MRAHVQRKATLGAAPAPSADGAGKDGLRGTLKGMTFDEGEAMLAPVQKKDGDKDGAAKTDGGGASATSTARLGISGPWFEISGDYVSHDNLLKTSDLKQAVGQNAYALIPPDQRAIHRYTPVDANGAVVPGAAPVWVITTKACWQQHKGAVEQARMSPYVPLRATLRNLDTGGIENDFFDIVVSAQDANGFNEFRMIYWGKDHSSTEYYDVAGAKELIALRSGGGAPKAKPKATKKTTVTSTTTTSSPPSGATKPSQESATDFQKVSQPGDASSDTKRKGGTLDYGASGTKAKTHF